MKKFIAVIMVAFVFLLTSNVAGAAAATTQVQPISSAAVTQVTPQFSSPTMVDSKAFGVEGIKPAWLYVSCYWAMNGARYCWRYGCSFYERVVLGCYDGWYRTTGWYA